MNNRLMACHLSFLLAITVLPAVNVPGMQDNTASIKAENSLLARVYFTFQVHQQAGAELEKMLKESPADQVPQIRAVFQDFFSGKVAILRKELETAFESSAQSRLKGFCLAYDKAEKDGDAAYLSNLGESLSLKTRPESYDALRKEMITEVLSAEISEVSRLIGEIQTWQEQKASAQNVPELAVWLKKSREPAVAVQAVKKAVDPLESAEAVPSVFVADEQGGGTAPLDDLSGLRDTRRKKALEDAKESMQQIASERSAAEADYAARKQREAQAEVDNMKRHSDRIVAANQEALDQRQKSFGNRLKNVLSATISAATGAFTGAVGARAGQAAVDALFGSSVPPAQVPPQPGTQPLPTGTSPAGSFPAVP